MTEKAPHPVLGFSVGITGHRADRITDPVKVRSLIIELLRAIDVQLDRVAAGRLYGAGRQPLSLVTSIAEGADRIAAHAALELGMPIEVVLPFRPHEYERDFETEPQRMEFRALLGRAASLIVIDGDEVDRSRGYEAAGMIMLDNSDLLIAIWDGGAARGRGGTREVLGDAARRGMPIVIIPPDGSSITLRANLNGSPVRFDDVPELPMDMLSALIASAVGTHSEAEEEAEWRQLADMPSLSIIHGAYPLLLKSVGLGKKKRKGGPPSESGPPVPAGPLADAFDWWDAAATRAAQEFRSAVIVNFGLAALAVVLAATSVLVSDLKWAFVIAEIMTIMALLLNTMRAGRLRWQERWLESRQVAELLRVCRLLRSVGMGRGIGGTGTGGSTAWYAGAVARSCVMKSVDLADATRAAEALITEVRDQASWNEATSHRMHLAAHRIERFGEVLFVIVLLAAIGWLGLYAVDREAAYHLKYGLTAITAGLPAIATASYGIRVILDFEGISNRARHISVSLGALLEEWEAGRQNSARLQEFAQRAADIMLSDVAAWRLLAEGRRLSIPG